MRLIDKNNVLQAVKALSIELDAETVQRCIEILSNQPTVDAVPVRHGKWLYDNQFHWYRASCNQCGYYRVTDIKAFGWNEWRFCPMCGARMKNVKGKKKND